MLSVFPIHKFKLLSPIEGSSFVFLLLADNKQRVRDVLDISS